MTRHRLLTCMVLGACCCAALFLASCASTSGSTLATVSAAEKPIQTPKTAPSRPVPPPSSSDVKKGLAIATDPAYAEVWVDGVFKGLSPYTFTDISAGWHSILLRKDGYRDSTAWLEFTGDYVLYQATLEQIKGFLRVSVTPSDSIVTVGGDRVSPGLIQLPVGAYAVRVRAFGFKDFQASVTIAENAITEVVVVLDPAPFALTSWTVPKTSVNPQNPGLLGTLDVLFSVTAPGGGTLRVRDAGGAVVYERDLPGFTTWDQRFSWNARDARGQALPDGSYALELSVHGDGSETAETRRADITVDRSLKIAPRSVWSGGAGLLYAPVAEVLPPGDFQVEALGCGIYNPLTGALRAPVLLSGRVGVAGGWEADAAAGVLATTDATHVLVNAAARWNWLPPRGGSGTSASLLFKAAGQFTPLVGGVAPLMTDTFANFTGVSVEAPFQVLLGPVSAVLSAGVTGSWWHPYGFADDGTAAAGPVAWMYLRGGVLLDWGPVSIGLSASTRTEQLPGGVALLADPVPFQAGAEAHWLIPGTRLVLSGIFAGEYQDEADFYFMGGGGLGFLY
jgi:hypothetical protein